MSSWTQTRRSSRGTKTVSRDWISRSDPSSKPTTRRGRSITFTGYRPNPRAPPLRNGGNATVVVDVHRKVRDERSPSIPWLIPQETELPDPVFGIRRPYAAYQD